MNNKLIFWLIVVLVLANVGYNVCFLVGENTRLPPMMTRQPRTGGPKDYIIKELGFNADQQKKYEELITVHHEKAQAFQQKIRDAKDAFFNLLKDSSVTESAKKTALAEISSQSEQLDLLTFEHFQNIRKICTEEQKKKFDGIIQQVLDMMARPKPPGNGPPQGGPPNGGPGMNRQRPDRPFPPDGERGPGRPGGPGPDGHRGPPPPDGPPPGGPEGRMGPPPDGPR